MAPSQRRFYGWRIVGVGSLVDFVAVGSYVAACLIALALRVGPTRAGFSAGEATPGAPA